MSPRPSEVFRADVDAGLGSSSPQGIIDPVGIPAGVGHVIGESMPPRPLVQSAPAHGIVAVESAEAIAYEHLRKLEGYKGEPVLFAYDDAYFPPRPVSPDYKPKGHMTIGWGRAYGVEPGDTCSGQEADDMLRDDVDACMEAVWTLENRCKSKGFPGFTSNMRAALACFAYNYGHHRLMSTPSISGRMLTGKYREAANGLSLYVKTKQNGEYVTSTGLVRRRAIERDLFLTGFSEVSDEVDTPENSTPVGPEPSIAKSTTVAASGGIGISAFTLLVDNTTGVVRSITGIPAEYQFWVLLVIIFGSAYIARERIRKAIFGEGY